MQESVPEVSRKAQANFGTAGVGSGRVTDLEQP